MKKAQPGKRRQTSAKAVRSAKRQGGPASVDEYISRVPEPAQSKLQEIRAAIRSVVPAETIEIISYRIPAFKHRKVLVWYAAFAEHCSLFPTAAVIEQFKDELTAYTISKGTIQFPLDKPVPTKLIKELVKARISAI
jgi:uncharacterized protein YdhG (YjbR/CyaY superfamily)